jgi:hypothetical protein
MNTFTKENLNTYLSELAKQYCKLAGKAMPAEIIQSFIRSAVEHPDLRDVYARIRENEQKAKATLISFEQRYPGVTTLENVDDILANLRTNEQSKDSLLASLRAKNKE